MKTMPATNPWPAPSRVARQRSARITTWLAGCAAAGAMASANAQSLVIDIPRPRAADWTQTVLEDIGIATTRAKTVNAAFREIGIWQFEFVIPASTGPNTSNDVLALVYQPQSWVPTAMGAIAQIDVSMNLVAQLSTFASGSAGSVRPILQQDGQFYGVASSGVSVIKGIPSPGTWSLLATDNWVRRDGSGGLDLSANASPIRFGLRWDIGTSCQGANGCQGAGAVIAADAIRFEIHPVSAVPEPGQWSMVLAGVLVLGTITLRRRRNLQRTLA